ncbi:MAG: fibronectin type III domain-containing protein [Acidobacteria bacterium]|nr:fibronectin type III domain-containing protein [Acidobacteriota bacterium]
MTRPLPPGRAVAAWLLGAAVAGCGAKGPPLPPLIIEPDRIAPLEVSRLDDVVYVEFEVPLSNTTGDVPADIVRVEVYALTTQPAEGEEEEFSEDWLEAATLIDSIPVLPPLPPGMEAAAEAAGAGNEPTGEDGPAGEGGRGPARQGDEITVVERLGAKAFVPVTVGEEDEAEEDEDADEEPEEEARPMALPMWPPPFPPPVIRTYVAFGVSSRDREGRPSSMESIPLVDPPGPPAAPVVEYAEASVRVTWEAPDTLRLPVQDPSYAVSDDPESEDTGPPLTSTPIVEWGEPSRYVVYDVAGLGTEPPPARPERLRPPGRTESYVDSDVVFGETRCYAVRVLDAVGELEIEGPESPASCVVLTDTFAPGAPTGLVAVADDGAVNLVWNANDESDLGGYLVLRASAPDATLQPLTPEPVERTRYRDAGVVPGQRYRYAVQAVDSAVPPNLSPPSPPIAESAR